MAISLEQTLEQIEKEQWNEPTHDSYLVTTCHRLRKKPLQAFTTEDFRILIGQNLSLSILIPLAFERLQQNIMVEGDYYPGDLLKNILTSEESYWRQNLILQRRLCRLYKSNLVTIEKQADQSIPRSILKEIAEAFNAFERINSG